MTRELVERAMHGDRDAFAMLAEGSLDRLVGTAGLILRDRDAADDAAQEALVRAWRDLPTIRNPDVFGSWLYRILLNRCADVLKRRRRAAQHALSVDRRGIVDDPAAGIADREELAAALDRLTDEHRAVVVLRFYVGLSQSEIADAIGEPLGTVKSRLSRAIGYLRAELDATAREARSEEELA
jgi:RNA polymerase sigma-70 factor (ECF subfamily)